MSDWKKDRDEDAAEKTAASQPLVGKAIAAARVEPHDEACDGVNVLVLTMADGSVWRITGGYGGYTGRSCDEYRERISVEPDTPPVTPP